MNPLQAPSSVDPFPWYATLRAQGGPVRCPESGLWLFARHEDVLAALRHPALRVRPEAAPDAPWLGDGAAAAIFRRHVRMSDGALHRDRRQRLDAAMRRLPCMAWLGQVAAEETAALLANAAARFDVMTVLAVPLPLRCVCRWLGLPAELAGDFADRAAAFAPALQPASGAGEIAAAHNAAAELVALLAPEAEAATLPFFAALADPAGPGRPLQPEEAVAGAVGLLAQTCDATAGLFGNSLRNLLLRPGLSAELADGAVGAAAVVEEVLRFDPPVHNTRRVAAADVEIGGARIAAGDTLLLLLAAAGRDPAVFDAADAFRPDRIAPDRIESGPAGTGHLAFGAGVHRCPGAAAARTVVAAGLAAALRLRPALALCDPVPAWRPAQNARIPQSLWVTG